LDAENEPKTKLRCGLRSAILFNRAYGSLAADPSEYREKRGRARAAKGGRGTGAPSDLARHDDIWPVQFVPQAIGLLASISAGALSAAG